MKKWILLLSAAMFLSITAKAGVLIEPYVGTYVNTKFDEGDEKKDVSGMSTGARIGYQNVGLMVGLDYQSATPTVSGSDNDYALTNYGLFIGYDFPALFRLWASFPLGGEMTVSNKQDLVFTKVAGTKIGFGYKMLPFLSLNLEVHSLDFKSPEVDGKDISGSVDDSSGNSMYVLGVSIPINI